MRTAPEELVEVGRYDTYCGRRGFRLLGRVPFLLWAVLASDPAQSRLFLQPRYHAPAVSKEVCAIRSGTPM
jgi:hypothetical protein